MSKLFQRLFLKHWPRKLVALISAFFIWVLVSQTITVTRSIPDVPVRIINIPLHKTISGLSSSGLMKNRISIALTGTKSTIKELRPTDLEIVINADGHAETWIATVDKRNLVSVGQQIDLKRHIKHVSANEILVKMSDLISEQIPVTIEKPVGDPPKGYQYLDIWPRKFTQTISGPEAEIRALKDDGLTLTLNLNRISKVELDELYQSEGQPKEVSFRVPDEWKTVIIPFRDTTEQINDPRAKLLRIDFLKQELIPLNTELPITIFFPVRYSKTINPQTYSLETNDIVQKKNGLKLLTIPLYVRDVSRLFLDVVRDDLLLILVADPDTPDGTISWAIEFINEKALEDAFVKAALKQERYSGESGERILRNRFREYLRKFILFHEDGTPIELTAKLTASTITLNENNPS